MKVKVCGITNVDDAKKAVACGAWAIGFIFYKKSPRHIGPYKAKKIIDSLPPFITPVGVFVNQKEGAVRDIASFCSLGALQFHGDESPSYCTRFKNVKIIKAFRVEKKIQTEQMKKYKVNAFLFDTYNETQFGGTGESFDWQVLKGVKNLQTPVILSGGLNPQNVKSAIEEVRPYAVDVCSGVESSPGRKDPHQMKRFFDAILL